MPELPEVETTRRGIAPRLVGRRLQELVVRNPRLRWPVPATLAGRVRGQRVEAVERRGKYLLLMLERGSLILHLGMSGSLRLLPTGTPPGPHDHLDLVLDGQSLRLHDPRRFGALLWGGEDPLDHRLLRDLGPEPLGPQFDGPWLSDRARGRRVAIKAFIMDSRIVVGVGNIYANEALFRAGIHPARAAGRIGAPRMARLAGAIREVLSEAIAQGGTTLRDFLREDGRPGYFAVRLQVYGRAGEPCVNCGRPLKSRLIGQRSSCYCGHCQR